MELDDYNQETLFRVEKVKEHTNTTLKEVNPRPSQPIVYGNLKMRIFFRRWRAKW